MDEVLKPEDYKEPVCPFCTDFYEGGEVVERVPVQRIMEKLDEYLNRNDYQGARQHLAYWVEEARSGKDLRGELSLRNESMGLFRKMGQMREAVAEAERADELIRTLQLERSVTAGTTWLNMATVYNAFQMPEKALTYYEKTMALYEKELGPDDARRGGLYNNMALALVSLGRFEEADVLYHKAISVMEKAKNGELEVAITYLNMANAAEARSGLEEADEEIQRLLQKAETLLDTPSLPRNGYYAFVCEKCAPTFSYYGWFFYAEELNGRVKKIYEGS